MQLQTLVALLSLLGAVNATHAQHARLAKRQAVVTASSGSTAPPTTGSSSASSGQSSSTSNSPVPTTPVGTTIPPLSDITSGMATPSTVPVTATYSAGSTPLISGAPTLPTPCSYSLPIILFLFYFADKCVLSVVFIASEWPAQDQIAPTGQCFKNLTCSLLNHINTQILRRSHNGCKNLMALTSQTSVLPQMVLVLEIRLRLRRLLVVAGGRAVVTPVLQISLLVRIN